MIYTIRRLGNGWYGFKELPQEGKYIKVEALNCGTDQKAINRARRVLGWPGANIQILDGEKTNGV